MSRILQLVALFATALVLLIASFAEAAPQVIIDVDGSVESMAALATLITHPDTSRNILLVTVTGTGWATLAVAENNVRAFLTLAGRDDIPIGIGTSSTLGDVPDVSAVERNELAAGGSCDDNRLFPSTPAMALARGLRRSRYDEDDLFGAADALPYPSNYGTKSKDSTAQMSTVYNQLTSTNRLAYIATAGVANLARFFKNANPTTVTIMLSRTDVHIYENGNNLPIDPSGSALVFEKQAAGLVAFLYTPSLIAPIRFNVNSYNSLKVAARSAGVKPYIAWLFSAINGRKNLIDGGEENTARANEYFADDTTVGAAFVAMVVADTQTANAGKGIVTVTNENHKHVQYANVVSAAKPGLGSLTLFGNNVTRGAYLQLIPLPALATGGGVIVITDPASKTAVGQSNSLADTFWSRWRNVMLP